MPDGKSFVDYPYAPFDKPAPPVPVGATRDICLRFDEKWIPYIFGALKSLAAKQTYQTDQERSVQEAWYAIGRAMQFSQCCEDQVPPPPCPDCEETMDCSQFRFLNGKLQINCCGVWTDVAGQPDGGFVPSTAVTPADLPAPGGCHTYNAVLNCGDQYLVPMPVSAGDTVLLSNINGATGESTDIFWFCQTGEPYFMGECQGIPLYIPTDPVLLAPHHSIIGSFDNVNWFPVGDAEFTVPSGIAKKQLRLAVNFPGDVAQGYGQYTFLVDVCNNQLATWQKVFDFTLNTQGWLPLTDSLVHSNADWLPGQGWIQNDQNFSGNSHERSAALMRNQAPFNLISMDITYNRTMGALLSTNTPGQFVKFDGASVETALWGDLPSGTNLQVNIAGPIVVNSLIELFLGCSNSDPNPTVDGTVTILGITISGTGPNPFTG